MTSSLPLTIRPQFAVECLRRSNQHGVGWVILEQNLEGKESTDVSQILARCDGAAVYKRNRVDMLCRFEHNARV